MLTGTGTITVLGASTVFLISVKRLEEETSVGFIELILDTSNLKDIAQIFNLASINIWQNQSLVFNRPLKVVADETGIGQYLITVYPNKDYKAGASIGIALTFNNSAPILTNDVLATATIV